MQYLKDNKLYTVDLKSIYGAAEEDINKVNQFLVKYTDQERYELAEKFFSIDEKDFETKYQFCKENDLIGCILGIFKFSEDFLKTLDER
jgi:type III secretory pathway component EscR